MYSVVLMAALTVANANPDWLGYDGFCDCYGSYYGDFGEVYGGSFGDVFGGSFGDVFGGSFDDVYGGSYDGGYGAPSYPHAILPGDGMMPLDGGIYPSNAGAPTGQPIGIPMKNKSRDRTDNGQSMLSSMNAKLVLDLPANAKLFINDMPMKATAGVCAFNTPALEPGKVYYCMVRIERMRNGEPVSETRRILARAGQVARADFKDVELGAVRTSQVK